MKYGIAIVGGNGSGKTTLGKELAKITGFKHMDIEDYYFAHSDNPYANPRTKKEAEALLLEDVLKYDRFIITSCNGDFGKEINQYYRYVIYIQVPKEIRIERVKQRSINQFGHRVLEGGDMYEQEQKFFDFVANRTMDDTEEWLKSLNIPIIYIDGTKTINENVKYIQKMMNEILDKLK